MHYSAECQLRRLVQHSIFFFYSFIQYSFIYYSILKYLYIHVICLGRFQWWILHIIQGCFTGTNKLYDLHSSRELTLKYMGKNNCPQTSNIRHMSITCWHWSNYSFILDLTPGFNRLGRANCKTRQETFKFWDLVHHILKVWWYKFLKGHPTLNYHGYRRVIP